jgi:hypothetical protein
MFLGLTRKDNPWQGVLANTPDLFCNGPLALSIGEKLDTMDRNALILRLDNTSSTEGSEVIWAA